MSIYKITLLTSSLFLGITFSSTAQKWNKVEIPATPTAGFQWELDAAHSDDFNYPDKNHKDFKTKWIDNHRGGWSGPGLTQFSKEYSFLKYGMLVIDSGIVKNDDNKRIYCGYVTSQNPIIYPVYTEVKMKVSGSWLSSNYWLLSADDVNEIDITETYGMDEKKGKSMNTNYHIFQRDPFKDLTPHHGKQHTSLNNVALKDGWHRFGVFWKSADEFVFYFDGRPVRTVNKTTDLEDPRGRYFDQPMHLIINMEDHPWRVKQGKTPTNGQLRNDKLNKMYVDWVRTYKMVEK